MLPWPLLFPPAEAHCAATFSLQPGLAQGRVFRLLAPWLLQDSCSVTWQQSSPSARHQLLPYQENENLKLFLAASSVPSQHWTHGLLYSIPPSPPRLHFLDWYYEVATVNVWETWLFQSFLLLAICDVHLILEVNTCIGCSLEPCQTYVRCYEYKDE